MYKGAHITGYIYYCHNASSLRSSLQSPRGIHITWQPYWTGVHISLVICVSPTRIAGDMYTGVRISRGYIYYCDKDNLAEYSLQRLRGIHKTQQPYCKHRSTDITCDMCIPTGKRISQVTCVRGHTYHTPFLHIYYCDNASSLRRSLQRPRGYITRQPY